MYRGSSFLLQHAYTVHRGVVEQLTAPRFSVLWEQEFGAGDTDQKLVPIILEAINAIREAYRPFPRLAKSRQPTDTLVTRSFLGLLDVCQLAIGFSLTDSRPPALAIPA